MPTSPVPPPHQPQGQPQAKRGGRKESPRGVPPRVPIRITERDTDILVWVARHGIVTMEQIARRFWPPSQRQTAAAARVRKLCMAHPPLLQRDATHIGEPSVIRVTPHGARLADVEIGPARLIHAEVHHALAIVDLTEALAEKYPKATLLTERERRAELYRAKRAGQRKMTGRIPDAVFVFPATGGKKERTVAVELDRTARSRTDAETVIKAYLAERYSEVWWYVRPSRVETVRALTKRMRVDDFIEVRPWVGA